MKEKKDIKLLTMDFDGTSLNKDQIYLTLRAMHDLELCQKKGIITVPSSGRVEAMFPPQIEKNPAFRYFISSGGSRVIDRQNNRVLYNRTFTPEETAEICALIENRGIYTEIAADGKVYIEQSIYDEIWHYKVPSHHVWFIESGRAITIKGKLSEYFLSHGLGAEKFNLYGVSPDDAERIKSYASDKSFILPLNNYSEGDIQFFNSRASRIEALLSILKENNLSFDNVFSIGDQMGFDSDLIESAAIGVAMGNADEKLKLMSDDVTLPYDKDGFALALEKWLLSD